MDKMQNAADPRKHTVGGNLIRAATKKNWRHIKALEIRQLKPTLITQAEIKVQKSTKKIS